jgi:hypothetical protein
MTEQTLVPESTTPDPVSRGGGRWRGAVPVLALLAVFAAVAFMVVTLAPSAGAAGGCGGG